MSKLEVGQWYSYQGQADWRRMKILEFTDKDTILYLDCYAEGTIEKRFCNSLQWAFDVSRGEVELVKPPDENWLKGGTDEEKGRQGSKGAGLSKRRGR